MPDKKADQITGQNLVGAFVPVAAVPMIVVLLVAIVTVHLPNGSSSIKLLSYDAAGAYFGQPGCETDVLHVAGAVLFRWTAIWEAARVARFRSGIRCAGF